MTLKIESNIKELVKKLEKSSNAMYFAFRNTLNDMAFKTREIAQQRTIPKVFTLRNQWAINSIRVDKAEGNNLRSETGTIWQGLADQEKGGSFEFSPASNIARSGSNDKVIGKNSRMPNLQGLPSDKDINSNGLMRQQASKTGSNPFILTRHKRMKKGIYRFRGSGKNKTPVMLRSFEQKKTTIKKRSWLSPATKALTKSMVRTMFIKNAKYQINNYL